MNTTTTTTTKAAWGALALALVTVTTHANSANLSEDQIAQAVATGLKGKNTVIGLRIDDAGAGFSSFMHSLDKSMNGYSASAAPSSGFWLKAYTPLAWIQQAAADAAKEYRTMSAEDVSEAMREDVFRIYIHPDTPTEVSGRGMKGTSSVQHVVLRDKAKKIVIQPLSKEPFTEASQNAMGAKVEFTGLFVTFSMSDLRELRGAKLDQEFVITVVGDREEKNFEVKKKHFKHLL